MKELEISIDLLKTEKQQLQISIGKPFDYGRSPGDEEYFKLEDLINKLKLIEAQLEFAEELLHTVKINEEFNKRLEKIT